MSFGSSVCGGSTYGGSANSLNEQVFFPLDNRDPDTTYEASVNFTGDEPLYSVFTKQGSESGSGPSGVEYKIYTIQSEGASPQLASTVQGNGQTVISSAPVIVVTAIIDSAVWSLGVDFRVYGRPGG